jgi:hypothetical protein
VLATAPACKDSSGPKSLIVITVSQVQGPATWTDYNGPRIECGFSLRAQSPGTEVRWLGASMTRYAGLTSEAIATTTFSDTVVRGQWGSTVLGTDPEYSGWDVTQDVPFSVQFDFHYTATDGSGDGETSLTASCGAVAATGTPPAVSRLAALGTGPVQPGDTFRVIYAANSAIGLWQSSIDLSGPCHLTQSFSENSQDSVTRSVSFILPTDCQLGVPITLSATVQDRALQNTVQSLGTGIRLVDVTGPVVGVNYPPTLGGEIFTYDTLQLLAFEADNHALRSVTWEVDPAGYRDSLRLTGAFQRQQINIPIQPSVTGPFVVKLWAVDSVGNVGDTLVSAPNAFVAYPTVSHPTRSTTVNGDLRDLKFDTKRGLIYVLQAQDIVVMSNTLQYQTTVSLPEIGAAFDFSAGGDTLLVALPLSNSLGIVDLRNLSAPVNRLRLTGMDSTQQNVELVRVAANGLAFVATQGRTGAAFQLISVDLGTGVQRVRTDFAPSGGFGGVMEPSYDRSVVVLNSGPGYFKRYIAAADSFGPGRTASITDATPVPDSGALHVAISGDLYDADLQHVLRMHGFSGGGYTVALTPGGQYHYAVWASDGVVRSRVSDGARLDRTPLPFVPGSIRISSDGALLAGFSSGLVSSICVVNLKQ